MKKNTISALFLSFLIASLVSCSGSKTTTETTTDSTAIATTTETATNPAFEKLLGEFENCEEVELLLKGESCGLLKEAEGKEKLTSLSTQILALTGENAALKTFETEDFLKAALTYEDPTAKISIHSLFKSSWEDLVFLTFTIADSSSSSKASTALVFTKSGEFKEAFTIFNQVYSKESKNTNIAAIGNVEKTAESFKLMIKNIEYKAMKGTETAGGFYVINKDGAVTHEESKTE